MINGLYTPLNLNCLAFLLQDIGLRINPTQQGYIGISTSTGTYTTRGSIYTDTLLTTLADATALAFPKIGTNPATQITQSTYDALVNMGSMTIPAFGNSPPDTYTNTYSGEITKYGFLRLIAYQAYQEFHVNGSSSYSDFLNTFITCYGFLQNSNQLIGNYSKSVTFLTSNYSNMNDLITSDITGVSLSTLYWGQDLIASGRAIDLKNIDNFGLPSVLLKTLSDNRALTASLNVALLSAGFTTTDISKILNNELVPIAQEKLLYSSFCVIMGQDLQDICVLLNCSTPNLNTLADLLDPRKLFPHSYQTLTCPKYNAEPNLPTNSKTYYKIYEGAGTTVGIFANQGVRLASIMPLNIANACDAFSFSMMQIKNIKSIEIEKFAQVVTNLENISDLNTGTGRFPLNPDYAIQALNLIAKGSGPDNTYTMCDFFGSMTDLHYDFPTLKTYLRAFNTTTLESIYLNMYSLLAGPGPYETTLLTYIASAEAEISNIQASNTSLASKLNTVYSQIGDYLCKEQNARSDAMPNLTDLTTSISDVYSFINNLNEFAVETQDNGPALVLENIADITTMGGTNLIGSMREIRNSERLGLAGASLDSGISNKPFILPRLNGDTSGNSPVAGYTPNNCVSNVPIVTGAAVTPGSLAGSPEVRLVPTNLNIFNTGVMCSTMTPSQALDRVISDNCDCWDN